jgi:type VII secretion protein EccB
MTSRRDQVQAYGFMMGRLSSALVHGEPDAARPPMQRTTGATVGGLALGAVGFLVCLGLGLLSPAGKAAAAPATGELIVVPQTGASYIYSGGKLRPVLNWSSARLLLNGSPRVENESATAVAAVPLGTPLGIVGAPNELPFATTVNHGDWLACAQSANGQPRTAVAIGARPAGAVPIPPGQALVAAAGNHTYLIWQGQRLLLGAPWIASALGLGQAPVIQVSQSWLNAVPQGPDLVPFSVEGVGGPGPVLDGKPTTVGEVLTTQNVDGPDTLYLVESNGVAEISATAAAVELASPSTAAAYRGAIAAPVAVSRPAIASAPVGHDPLPDGAGVPPSPPSAATPSAGGRGGLVPCIAYPGTGGMPPMLLWSTAVGGSPPDLNAPGVTAGTNDADLVNVASGGGALVQPLTPTGAPDGPPYLVTGDGDKFAIPTADEIAALGYQANKAAKLPAALLGLLPTGPPLDLAPLRG